MPEFASFSPEAGTDRPPRRERNHAASGLLILAFGVVAACQQPWAAETGEGRAASLASSKSFRVSVTKPTTTEHGQDLVLPGSLEGYEKVELYAQVTGYLKSIEVDIGDEVEAGAEIARLRVPEVRAQLRSASAEIASARAQVERGEINLELASVKQERLDGLHAKDSGAVAKHDVDVATVGKKAAQAELSAARADVQRAQAERSRLAAMTDFSVIRAPFAGRVLRRNLHPGSLVRAGTTSGAQPIVELVRTAPLRLVIYIPESLAGYTAKGQAATVTVDAFPNEKFGVQIARTAGALDPKTRSMRAEFDVDNGDGRLKPGMFANVSLSMVTLPGALSVPSKALRGNSKGWHVLVVRDGKAVEQKVTIASDDGRRAIVTHGVSARDQVIVAASPLVSDGSEVEILERAG